MPVPASPKIYHIVHVDRLASILASGGLLCDATIVKNGAEGSTIGMGDIKKRRLTKPLQSHSSLYVGSCVPFYFCPRSVMLYVIHQANHSELAYRGGQVPIVHLEADLRCSVAWADANAARWAFTTSNAGSSYFEDQCDLTRLNEIDWDAVKTNQWAGAGKEGKQAEFLIEDFFPWELVERIGVHSMPVYQQTAAILKAAGRKTAIEIKPTWYY